MRPPASRSSVLCGYADTSDASDEMTCVRDVSRRRGGRAWTGKPSSESQVSGLRAMASADNLNSAHTSSAERPLCSANRFRNSHGSSCGRFTALSLHTCACHPRSCERESASSPVRNAQLQTARSAIAKPDVGKGSFRVVQRRDEKGVERTGLCLSPLSSVPSCFRV